MIPHLTRQQQLKNELICSKSLTYTGNTTLGLKKSRLIQTYLKIHLSEVHINVDLGFSQLPQAPEKMTQKKRNGKDVQRTSKYDRLMGHSRSVPDGQPRDISKTDHP